MRPLSSPVMLEISLYLLWITCPLLPLVPAGSFQHPRRRGSRESMEPSFLAPVKPCRSKGQAKAQTKASQREGKKLLWIIHLKAT